jgi:hypothetical protein
MHRFVIFLLLLIVAWCYWPATRGDFVIDDYVFIAQSRMIDAPWEAFWSNHFYEPVYFRPIGVVFWWIATKLFALNYAAHSAINLALHAVNIVLVAVLVRSMTGRVAASFAAAALFALLPFSFAATLWPSNRFDLLATAFSLLVAIFMLRYFESARPGSWVAMGAFTLLACWSKELAFPMVTAIAFAAWLATRVTWQRRLAAFAMIGIVTTFAFVWRHLVLPLPYVVAGGDTPTQMQKGIVAWFLSAGALLRDITGWAGPGIAALWMLAAVVLLAIVATLLFSSNHSRAHTRGDTQRSPLRSFAAIALVFIASVLPQLPLLPSFSAMLNGDPVGTITFARFYYAPTAVVAIGIGVLISYLRFSRSVATVAVLAAIAVGFQQRELGERAATWLNDEVRPMSNAATRIVDALSASNSPCVAVFLGTQNKHTWFRMFSDVTVKALTAKPDTTWRCHVLTESTPWIFISPASTPLADLGLPTIPLDTKGTPKPDYVWGGVRYRYRLIANDLAQLPNARFFEWDGKAFTDVTDNVRNGTRPVKSQGWGF